MCAKLNVHLCQILAIATYLSSTVVIKPCSAQNNPCPTIFQYKYDSRRNLYGTLTINSPSNGRIKTHVQLSVGNKLDAYNGQLELAFSKNQAIDNVLTGRPLQYNVLFPRWNGDVPPQLTRIVVNDQAICTGPSLDGSSLLTITKVTLDHLLTFTVPPGLTVQKYAPPSDSYETDVPQQQHNVLASPGGTNRYHPTFDLQTNPNFSDREPNRKTATASNRPIEFNPQKPKDHHSPPAKLVFVDPPAVVKKPEIKTETGIPIISRRFGDSQTIEFGDSSDNDDHDQGQCGISTEGTIPLIVRGSKVSKGEFPWLVAMFEQDNVKAISAKYRCAGSLLSNRHILTAAHCCRNGRKNMKPEDLTMVLGKLNVHPFATETGSKNVGVSAVYVHEEYETNRADADLCLIKMEEHVKFTPYIRPICLWNESVGLESVVGESGTVAGWGKNEDGELSVEEPARISMPIVSNTECVKSYSGFANLISTTSFCAGRKDNSGPCNGDSGSGLILKRNNRWTLRGIVSAALNKNGECDLSHYIIFTDVARHLPWLKEALKK